MAPAPDARHPAERILMHTAYQLWADLGLSDVLKALFSPSRTALCRTLQANFAEFSFHEVR